jgi:hypothetical protein
MTFLEAKTTKNKDRQTRTGGINQHWQKQKGQKAEERNLCIPKTRSLSKLRTSTKGIHKKLNAAEASHLGRIVTWVSALHRHRLAAE